MGVFKNQSHLPWTQNHIGALIQGPRSRTRETCETPPQAISARTGVGVQLERAPLLPILSKGVPREQLAKTVGASILTDLSVPYSQKSCSIIYLNQTIPQADLTMILITA